MNYAELELMVDYSPYERLTVLVLVPFETVTIIIVLFSLLLISVICVLSFTFIMYFIER